MDVKRHRGYVVGHDSNPSGSIIWKVRVKDPADSRNGEKLVVASTRGNIELARGLNVEFIIGTIDGPNGQKISRAVDVMPDPLEQ